jgi:hypothetical protein
MSAAVDMSSITAGTTVTSLSELQRLHDVALSAVTVIDLKEKRMDAGAMKVLGQMLQHLGRLERLDLRSKYQIDDDSWGIYFIVALS